MFMCEKLFNDRRIVTWLLLAWTILTATVFYSIMHAESSPFLVFGPNTHSKLFGVKLDTWTKWWAVTIYTFISTFVAAFASDSVVPFITNTVQDHKTIYIPYSKTTCLLIIQIFTCYSVVISIVGLFVALTQIDFTVVRLLADLIVNHITTSYFLRGKVTDSAKYNEWLNRESKPHPTEFDILDEEQISLHGHQLQPVDNIGNTSTST